MSTLRRPAIVIGPLESLDESLPQSDSSGSGMW